MTSLVRLLLAACLLVQLIPLAQADAWSGRCGAPFDGLSDETSPEGVSTSGAEDGSTTAGEGAGCCPSGDCCCGGACPCAETPPPSPPSPRGDLSVRDMAETLRLLDTRPVVAIVSSPAVPLVRWSVSEPGVRASTPHRVQRLLCVVQT